MGKEVKKMVQRSNVDCTHYGYSVGKLGRVLPLMYLPVYPGDIVDIQEQIYVNMSPLRRAIMLDANVSVVSFFVRHRHIYDTNWTTFIEEGYDTSETLATDTANNQDLEFMPGWISNAVQASKPKWYTQAYLDIWNYWYKPKAQYAVNTNDASWTSVPFSDGFSQDTLNYGFIAANMQNALWTQTVNKSLAAADVDLDVSGATLDIRDIEQQQARARTETQRDWFNYNYENIIDQLGGNAPIDAEPRPEKLWQDTQFMSGENIRLTDNQSAGGVVGRPGTIVNHMIPSRFIPEHGTIWTMLLVRYPAVSTKETHYLVRKTNDYKNAVMDPNVVMTEKPVELQIADIFDSASNSTLSYLPYGHWHRSHPTHVHKLYEDRLGFSFAKPVPTADIGENFYDISIDDANFQSTQLGHFNVQAKNNIFVQRCIPEADASIFAGMKT